MKIQPTTNKPQPTFGIYISTKQTPYGECIYGNYRGYNIEIYNDKRDNAKLYYVSDGFMRWLKSKLKYIVNGKEKILRSERRS